MVVRGWWLVALALVGCGDKVVYTDDLNETRTLLSYSVGCDGEASVFDWLFYADVETTVDVVAVSVDLRQAGEWLGSTPLARRDGLWTVEVWEEDLGLDCEGRWSAEIRTETGKRTEILFVE